MKLYIKQHIFSWGDRFSVYDGTGNERYQIRGEVFSFGKKLHLCGADGAELAFIHQKVLSFLPRYYISRGSQIMAEVVKEFTFLKQKYSVLGPGWTVEGDFFSHEFVIREGSNTVAVISKEWFSLGDAYAIDIRTNTDETLVLATVLIIDACIDAQQNNNN